MAARGGLLPLFLALLSPQPTIPRALSLSRTLGRQSSIEQRSSNEPRTASLNGLRKSLKTLIPRKPQSNEECTKTLAYKLLHLIHRGDTVVDRVAVFMIGLPGAGKSRVIAYRYTLDRMNREIKNSTVVLDLDKEIAKHPEYDANDPDRLHLAKGRSAYLWADARVEAQFNAGLRDPNIKRLVVDGTGTNVDRQIRRMTQAREAGFFVKAMYVRVPARTAIARAAMRKRGVTPSRIAEYQTKLAGAMAVASEHADEFEIIDVTFDDAPLPGTMEGTCVDPITVVGGFDASGSMG